MKYMHTDPRARQRRGRENLGIVWKIIFLQMTVSIIVLAGIALGAVLLDGGLEVSRGAVVSVFSQDELDLEEELSKIELQPWLSKLQELLNRSIYVPGGTTGGMGGELPEHSQKEGEIPSDATLQRIALQGELCPPLSGTITSRFGSRLHPISREQDFHKGIDIAAAQGSAIHVVSSGTVKETGCSKAYGNYIIVRHSEHFDTAYCHCESILAREGDRLRQGERIATVGSTGISTGPHLHFEVRVDGMRANPLWVLPQ